MTKQSIEILTKLSNKGLVVFSDLIDMSQDYNQMLYRKMYKHLWGMASSGFVKIKKDSKNVSFFHLTPKGKLRILKYLHLEKLKLKKWDKQWRVLIFDIPEARKKLREYLRHYLRNLGFFPLQESVYIFPHPVPKELENYLKTNSMRKYCYYLTVSEMDGEEQLKSFFGLK